MLDSSDKFITISHVAKTKQLFASGSLEWIKWIETLEHYGLIDSFHDKVSKNKKLFNFLRKLLKTVGIN